MLELIIKLVCAIILTAVFMFFASYLGVTGVVYALAFLIVGSAVYICHKLNELKKENKPKDEMDS